MYVRVHVNPKAKKESVTKQSDTEFQMSVREPRERNMANKRVIELLARELKVPVANIRMLTGHRSTSKMFSVDI